jgi:hypothetical protein
MSGQDSTGPGRDPREVGLPVAPRAARIVRDCAAEGRPADRHGAGNRS